MQPQILFEDNHLLLINKPVCVPVQADKTGDPSLDFLLRDWLKARENKPGKAYLVPVHRLDRPASGVLVFAKSSKAAGRMGDQFRDSSPDKHYHIWVEPRTFLRENIHFPEKDIVELERVGSMFDWIGKKPHGTAFICSEGTPKAKSASLDYEILKEGKKRKLVSVQIHTGRHHQIRIQFASRGWSVVGDKRYGAKRALKDKSIALHAFQLDFAHPITKEMLQIVAPVPVSWTEWGPKTGR